MQANTEFTITDYGILVWQDITDFQFVKTEQSVKAERVDYVARLYAEFEELT